MNFISHRILSLDTYSKKNYKYRKFQFDYILKKDFETYRKQEQEQGREIRVIGIFKAKSIKPDKLKETDEAVSIGTNTNPIFFLFQREEEESKLPKRKILGYVRLENGCYAAVLKKVLYLPILFLFLAFGITVGILFFSVPENRRLLIDHGLDIVEDPDIVTEESEAKNETTEIPVYSEFTINEEQPFIRLINPKGNTVYFEYEFLDLDGTSIYKSSVFPPGRMIETDLGGLSKGDHRFELVIHTYDVESEAPCSNATEPIIIHVE